MGFEKFEKIWQKFQNQMLGKNNFFEMYEDLVVYFLRDLLEFGINICIGGLYWKNIDFLKKLLIIEIIKFI